MGFGSSDRSASESIDCGLKFRFKYRHYHFCEFQLNLKKIWKNAGLACDCYAKGDCGLCAFSMSPFFYINKCLLGWKQPLFLMSLGMALGLNAELLRAQQVSPDGTFNTVVANQNNLNFTITNGTRSGQNLFHSFRDFSIPKDGSATFDLRSSPTIVNIFSRVTGPDKSDINGLVRTIGGNRPNVFLLNSNGILFGPQAKLDIGGSFLATTGQGIQFDNGILFDIASLPETLLNVRVPIGVQMGINPGVIQIDGRGHSVVSQGSQLPYKRNSSAGGLRVKPGNTLALLGGEIVLNGGILTAENIELGTPLQSRSGENAWVGLSPISNGFTIDYSQVGRYGNIQLSKKALVDVSSQSAGNLQIQTQDLTLRDGSLLFSSAASPIKGQIKLVAQGTILMDGRSPDRSVGSGIEVYAIESGEGPAIDITAKDLIILDIARVSSRAYEKASTGNIRIQGSQSVQLDAGSSNSALNVASIIALTNGQGNAGDIAIRTPLLQVMNDAVISAATLGAGNAGNVGLVTDRIEVARGGNIGSSSFVQGNAGSLVIQTRSIDLSHGGLVSSNSLGRGDAGSIDITASESVILFGRRDAVGTPSQIRSTVRNASLAVQQRFGSPATATGNGGSIVIRSPNISLDQNAQINVRNEGLGEGGDITLQTQQLQIDNQSSLNAATRRAAGGNISLNADSVSLRRGSSVNATAGSRGQGGLILINTGVLLGLENSDIIANAVLGDGGQIRIKTDQIYGLEYRSQLTNESDITAISQYGMNGSVSISELRLDPNPESLPLPMMLSDEKQRISDRCHDSRSNRFIITGRGGLPKAPLWNLDSNRAWRDIRDVTPSAKIAVPEAQTPIVVPATLIQPTPLVEASIWRINLDGSVSLLAPESGQSEINIASATCAVSEVLALPSSRR